MAETSDTRRHSLPPAVVHLGWVSFLTDVSSEMIIPLLPAFLATLSGVPAMALGWIEGVAEATASTLKVVSGRIADRRAAKKPLVLLGYGVSSLARPLISLAHGWPVVLLLRFVDRVGKGIRTAPRDALIAGIAPDGRRGAAYGLHRGFDNAGEVVGPLLAAGLILAFGLSMRVIFALAALPALLSVAVLLFGVKEVPAAALQTPSGDGNSAALPPVFRRLAGAVTLFTLAASSDVFLLLKARQVGVPAALLPVLWAFSNAVRAALSKWGGGLSDTLGRKRLLVAAWSLYTVTYAVMAFVESPWVLALVIGVYSVYYALYEGTERALVADLVPARSRGHAFGWLFGLEGLAALPASVGFGWIWERFGSRTAFLTDAAIAGAALVALATLVPGRARKIA